MLLVVKVFLNAKDLDYWSVGSQQSGIVYNYEICIVLQLKTGEAPKEKQ